MGNEASPRSERHLEERPLHQLYAPAQDKGSLKASGSCWNDEHLENLVYQSFDDFEG
jgi:hypothetical protein